MHSRRDFLQGAVAAVPVPKSAPDEYGEFLDRVRQHCIHITRRDGRGLARIVIEPPGGTGFRLCKVWLEGWNEWQPPYTWYEKDCA
jgi:hypothetical protein